MKNLSWQFQRTVNQLSGLGIIGIALIVLSGFIYLQINNDKQAISQLTAEINHLKSQPPHLKIHDTVNSVAIFYQWLPDQTQISKQLRNLHQLADAQHLSIDEANYKISSVAGTKIIYCQMAFPLTGDYQAIRRYISVVLQTFPNASFENIALKRTNAKANILNAEINLTFYYRGA